MGIEIFLRVVKLKDGTYCVRRLSKHGWKMLDLDSADEWYITKEVQRKFCYGTKDQAKFALERWNSKNRTKKANLK